MSTEQVENIESLYSKGFTLNDAIFEYGDSKLLAELQENKVRGATAWDGKEVCKLLRSRKARRCCIRSSMSLT